jgi:hypothetical protein
LNKITYYGSEKEISRAVEIIKNYEKFNPKAHFESMSEGKARLIIQQLIDENQVKASILINNNTVWSKDRIIRNLEQIMHHGTLYNTDQTKPPILSHYFYQFLHLVCGSLNHYDIHGWIHKYPTVEHLKKFFKSNEFGKRVLDTIPKKRTDARAIVETIESRLFPFETYMKQREK